VTVTASSSLRCIVIAGPNGAGKTTFAKEFLARQDIVHFVNADLIASGLSALDPRQSALTAGRVFLAELDRLVRAKASFAFEATLSGLTLVSHLERWRAAGYQIEIVYLRVDPERLALRRIAARVKQGGHAVPRDDVVRRFARSWSNFIQIYRPLADEWSVYDNSGITPQLVDSGP
jgi:predicted ABC-type ATPase